MGNTCRVEYGLEYSQRSLAEASLAVINSADKEHIYLFMASTHRVSSQSGVSEILTIEGAHPMGIAFDVCIACWGCDSSQLMRRLKHMRDLKLRFVTWSPHSAADNSHTLFMPYFPPTV